MHRNYQRRCVIVLPHPSCAVFIRFSGGCDLDKSYEGPKLPQSEDGKFSITLDFIHAMIEWFKAGKTLPRR